MSHFLVKWLSSHLGNISQVWQNCVFNNLHLWLAVQSMIARKEVLGGSLWYVVSLYFPYFSPFPSLVLLLKDLLIWFTLTVFCFIACLIKFTVSIASSKTSSFIWSSAGCWEVPWIRTDKLPQPTKSACRPFWHSLW